MTRTFKIYGRDGHSFRYAHCESQDFDWSEAHGAWARTVRIHVSNSDETGTADYSIVTITAPTPEMITHELWAQLDDGIFEDCRHGKVTEVIDGREIPAEYHDTAEQ